MKDISIVGLLTEAMSELITPPLTTISFPQYDMGYEATKILVSQLTGAATTPQQILLQPQLIVRGSTGPAPTHR
jgi:DNA-binding LacI/PurR family transcriptional regulator